MCKALELARGELSVLSNAYVNMLTCALLTSYFQNFELHTPFLYVIIFTFCGLALALCQYCNVRYPTGFKPAITVGRSNQIASNSVVDREIPQLLECSVR